MRKLLIVSIVPLLAAGCCSDDGMLRRFEVWKQQSMFTPDEPQMMAPMAAPCAPEPTCGYAPPVVAEPTCAAPAAMAVEPTCGQPIGQTVASPEVIDGVLEQP